MGNHHQQFPGDPLISCNLGVFRINDSNQERRSNLTKSAFCGVFLKVFLQKTAYLTLVKSRLALGSPGWLVVRLFVTMLKMAQYTGKWLLTAP